MTKQELKDIALIINDIRGINIATELLGANLGDEEPAQPSPNKTIDKSLLLPSVETVQLISRALEEYIDSENQKSKKIKLIADSLTHITSGVFVAFFVKFFDTSTSTGQLIWGVVLLGSVFSFILHQIILSQITPISIQEISSNARELKELNNKIIQINISKIKNGKSLSLSDFSKEMGRVNEIFYSLHYSIQDRIKLTIRAIDNTEQKQII
jgi:hypothetical protein